MYVEANWIDRSSVQKKKTGGCWLLLLHTLLFVTRTLLAMKEVSLDPIYLENFLLMASSNWRLTYFIEFCRHQTFPPFSPFQSLVVRLEN